MPVIERILETVLYVGDLDAADAFYAGILGLSLLHADRRMRAYDVGGNGVLLLFVEGQSREPVETPGGVIPAHDGQGPVHIAFSIPAHQLVEWTEALARSGVPIEGRTTWPRGGTSLYVRDPDGHLVELATPGLWKGY